jgi:hypothetical protein
VQRETAAVVYVHVTVDSAVLDVPIGDHFCHGENLRKRSDVSGHAEADSCQ